MGLFPRKSSEKRKQYRVQVDGELAASVQDNGQWRPAPLLDVSSRGAAVFVNTALGKSLSIDHELSLRFALRGRGKAIEAVAVVRSTEPVETQLGDGQRIGLEFSDCEALHDQLDVGYWPYFNRRKTFRVQASGKKPEVRITWPGKRLEGKLDELSIAGCAVSFERETLLLLVPGSRVQAEFVIPETEKTGRFTATVVHRGVRGSRLCIGLTFEGGDTPNFSTLQELLLAHVLRREREFLQRGS